ncbi:MAG: helix-turn-helix domain-containing protein [Prevotellaceae bacterium]|jgi:transcriptional regulator with XRE-family HTH domain|nr:helix-turn-helix domain-containing protein [Prevotellaceae bacterium]
MKKMKLQQARIKQHMTQKGMADILGMTQSQYYRRESGEIYITDNEWVKMAKALDVEVDEIRENDPASTIYNYDNHSGNYSASNNYFYNIPDFVMKNQQEYIDMLKNKIVELQENLELQENTVRLLREELHRIETNSK